MSKIIVKYAILVLSIVANVYSSKATHIIGGDITYQHVTGDTYEISFTFRRDCFTGDPEAQFDRQAVLWIFDDNGRLLQQYGIGGRIIMDLNPHDTLGKTFRSDCGFEGEQVCVQETTYKKRVRLPYRPGKGGYTLAYQRCCRNNTLVNILEPENTGGTWITTISEKSLATQNSSPVFDKWPDIYICTDEDINYSHAATDKDGDSLVYKLYTPYAGLSDNRPVTFGPPYAPYAKVEWKTPYGLNNLLGGDPLRIDAKTGKISGTPNQVGQYLVGVVVEEYRDGELLGFTRRDFQYNVRVCTSPPSADFVANDGICEGTKVSFKNNSVSATGYKWNFNYPSQDPKFFSTEANPTFTYPEEGVYQVQLIATRGVDSCKASIIKRVPAIVSSIKTDFDLSIEECRSDGDYTIRLQDKSTDTQPIVSRLWKIVQDSITRTSDLATAKFNIKKGVFTVELVSTSETGCSGKKTVDYSTDDFMHKASFRYQLESCADANMASIVFYNTSDSINKHDATEMARWTISSGQPTQTYTGDSIRITADVDALIEVDLEVDFGGGCRAFVGDSLRLRDLLPRLDYSYTGTGCSGPDSVTVDFTIADKSKGFGLVEAVSTIYNTKGDVLVTTDSIKFTQELEKNKPIRLVTYGKYDNGCVDTLDVTFVPGPYADIQFTANPRKICQGDTLPLIKEGSSSWRYIWTPVDNLYFAKAGDGSSAYAVGVKNTTYSVVVTDGICTESASIDVEVLDGNNLKISGDLIVCDDNVSLKAAGGIPPGQFEWSRDGAFSNIIHRGTDLNTTLQDNIDTFYVRYTGETCGDDYVQAVVQKRIFALDVGGPTAVVCLGDTISLLKNPNPNFTYQWTSDPALFLKDSDPRKPYVVGISDRTLTVTVSDGKCVETKQIVVDVLDKKDVKIQGDALVCEADSISLSVGNVTGDGIFEWSNSPTYDQVIATGLTLKKELASDKENIYVRYTGKLCGEKEDKITVTRSNIDISFLSPPIRVCKGDSIRLVVNPNSSYTYEWQPSEGLLFDPSDEVKANPLFVGVKDVEYTVKVLDGKCSKQYTINVDVADTKNITIEGRSEICDDNVSLTASGADGTGKYEWSATSDFTTILSTGPKLVTTLDTDSMIYYVRHTDTICGVNTQSYKVKKYTFNLFFEDPYPVCVGDTLNYTVFNIGSGNLSYVWDKDPHIIDGADSGSPVIVFGRNEPDTVRLSFTATTATGCTTKKTVRFVIDERKANDFFHTIPKCGELKVCFAVKEKYRGFIRWDFGDPTSNDDLSIKDTVCYTYSQPGVYKVKLENITSACSFNPVEKNIVVNDTITINNTDTQLGCIGETVVVSASSSALSLDYKWITLDGTVLSNGSQLSYNVSKIDTVVIEATDPNGCATRDSVRIMPHVYDITTNFPAICGNENITLGIQVNGTTTGYTYEWSPSSIIVSGGTTANPVVSITEDTRIGVTIKDTLHGCETKESYLLEHTPLDVKIVADPSTTINRGQSVTLSTDPADNSYTYTWSNGEATPSITVSPLQDTTYTVTVVEQNGCSDTTSANIKVLQPKCDESDVFLPIAFTPNGDGVNDVLYVRSNFIETMELVIFNRWGQEIFRTTDQSKGWDGTYDGATLQPDAFAYYLKVRCVNGVDYAKQGNINLLK